ncbi:YkvS family protein [Bacillus marinisedimentorum]|uniref:YkvS family protein n=1 Tax=Bacillus marinisedimentorum TaxID=1821260 RepID=UPI000872705F|nr:YkvS family protein [Bacillus marinisedimentorum]
MMEAKVGDIVEFKDGWYGKVEKVLTNSVIVDLTVMDHLDELEFEFEKTVVAHKNYKIVKSVGV